MGLAPFFHFGFPLREENGAVTMARVLIIDDDPNARDLMFRYLTRDGFHVWTATSGPQGIQAAREYKPDVITLDVMMPEMDGWTVLRELKADPDLHDIPVIMVTIVNDQKREITIRLA